MPLTKKLKVLIIFSEFKKILEEEGKVMKKLVSFMLSLALLGMIGLTTGCKKKEEVPKQETPKTETTAPEKTAPIKKVAPTKKTPTKEKTASTKKKTAEHKPVEKKPVKKPMREKPEGC